MGLFIKRKNNVNVPAGIRKDPINIANVRNHEARVDISPRLPYI